MTDQFLGEIRVFPSGFQPTGWAACSGQLMSIPQNTALYSILGTVYGGDGRTTFALPNLNGRAASGVGQGPGLSSYLPGQQAGSATVVLEAGEMPTHNHRLQASAEPGELQSPSPTASLSRSNPGRPYGTDPDAGRVQMAPEALSTTGGGQPHNNMPPVLALNFCIALQGVFPERP